MHYEAQVGEDIKHAVAAMRRLADEADEAVETDFNGVQLTMVPAGDVAGIVAFYSAEMGRRAEAYRTSPEGRRAEAESRRAIARQHAAAHEPLPPFTLTDADAWGQWVDANRDPYGAATLRFAQRWAGLMEPRIAAGEQLAAIAETTSHEADTEGVSGFMAGTAAAILSRCWLHGAALARWKAGRG